MQTIDIAQAIKENSTSVSQNLDSSVLEGLMPVATISNNGLLSKEQAKFIDTSLAFNIERKQFYKAFNLKQYGLGLLVISHGDATNNMINTEIFILNNRCQGALSIAISKITDTSYTIYAKYNSDNSIDFYFKADDFQYPYLAYKWIISPGNYQYTPFNIIDSSALDSNLTAKNI